MKVFEFTDYRQFIRFRVESTPGGGRGQYRRIAEHLDIPTSMVSQVMSGARELNLELASLLAEYFGLTDAEADYLLNLVELERAGNPSLRARLRKRLELARKKGMELSQRIEHERTLSEREKLVFYSQWYYSGIRLLTSIEGRNSLNAIADDLRLPRTLVGQVVEFLLSTGLCIEEKGKIRIGPKSTHVGNDSPMVIRHHMNWRLKSMSQMKEPREHEVIFTGPVTLSLEACHEVKKRLLHLIDDWGKIVDSSKEEKLACLNIDWVEIT